MLELQLKPEGSKGLTSGVSRIHAIKGGRQPAFKVAGMRQDGERKQDKAGSGQQMHLGFNTGLTEAEEVTREV